MKKLLIAASLLLALATAAKAQDIGETVDTLSYNPQTMVDESLSGRSLEGVLPGNVTIKQSSAVRSGLASYVTRNASRMHNGFRIRIYYDNSQTSRAASEKAVRDFKASFPGISAYRSFANTYFKVVVGDFRNRIDAEAALEQISPLFPSAVIIRDKFKYPAI